MNLPWKHLRIIFFSLSMVLSNVSLAQVDKSLDDQKADCAKNSATQWSNSLNRCVGKAEDRQTRHDVIDCNKLADLEARKNCQLNIASQKSGISGNPEEAFSKTSGLQSRSLMVNGAYTVISAISYFGQDKAKSSCMCKSIFGVTSLGGVVTDILMKTKTKSKLKELQDKYKLEAKDTPFQAQKKALEYLKEEQQLVKEIAGMEKQRQMLLILGYGAAAATAGYEAFVNTSCWEDKASTSASPATPSTTAVPAIPAVGVEATAPADAPVAGIGSYASKFGSLLSNPPGIMVLAGIGAINSAMLYSAAGDQEKECDDNIKKIDLLITAFTDSFLNYCPNGRETLSDPNCYCYLDSGKENPNRTNSQTCIDLWAKNNYRLSAIADNYNGIAKNVDPLGCVNKNGKFDAKCDCKKFIDSKGQNSCMKSISIKTNGNELGLGYLNNSGFDNVTKALVNQAQGKGILSNISVGKLASAIAKQGLMNSQIFQKISNDPSKAMFTNPNDRNAMLKAQKALFNKDLMAKANSAFGGKNAAYGSIDRPLDAKLNDLVKAAENQAGLDLTGTGVGLHNKKLKKNEAFNFNVASDSANANHTQDFPEMKKNYNYKNSDISTKPDASIFEIISNRYLLSGLRKLFDN